MAATDLAGAPVMQASKDEWVRQLRLRFCRENGMVDEAGEFDPAYFKPKSLSGGGVWSDECRDALIAGIGTFGVGDWESIHRKHFPSSWSAIQLQIKACKLFGRQNLDCYAGWKGDTAAIAAEFEKNKAEGLASGRWNGIVLTDGDVTTSVQVLLPVADADEKDGPE